MEIIPVKVTKHKPVQRLPVPIRKRLRDAAVAFFLALAETVAGIDEEPPEDPYKDRGIRFL